MEHLLVFLIIGSLESGIVALGLSGFYVQFINGLMITIAVTIYALIQKRKTNSSIIIIILVKYFRQYLH